MDGARVDLTHAGLAESLAKGKVTFAWGQIRAWLQPAPVMDTAGAEMTELVLPLKVLAPAWFAHSRPGARRRTVEVDDSIPALFGGGRAFTPVESAPAPVEDLAPPAETAPPEESAPVHSMRLAPSEELAPSLSFAPDTQPASSPEPRPRA